MQPTCQKLVRGQTHTQSLFMSLEERERRLDSIEVRMVPCHHAQRLGTSLVRGLVFKETVVLDQWGKKTKIWIYQLG